MKVTSRRSCKSAFGNMMKSEVFTQGDIKPSLPSTIKLDHSREDRTMDDLRYYSKRDIITSDNEDDENESLGLPETELQDYIQRVYGVQQWPDGCEYRGEFGRNMKLGYGVFEWKNGEKYRGQFYKDHRHGSGTYSWPDGCTFTGTFYLSHREGYGTMYLKNRVFQGLYRADQRFGPGIESYAEGYQDVGWWFREHIIKLCMEVPGTFSILDYPEYIPFLTFDSEKGCHSEEELTKWDLNEEEDPFFYDYKRFLLNEDLTLPPEMYVYSTDNEHLPVTPGSKKDFDFYFLMPKFPIFDDEEEPWFVINQSPLILKIQKHACRFRHTKVQYIRSINDIMNGNRSNFGQRGPKERLAKELIVKSIKGDFDRVYEILRDDLVLADVADSRGFTALAAATIHSHNAIINLLLDNGANVNVSTDEGVTPLCMCFVLYYSNEKFKPNIAERNLVIKPTVKPSKAVSVGTTMPEIKFPSPATTLESTFQTSSLDMRRVLDKTASSLDGTISQLSKSQSESRSGILKRDESVMTPSERAVSSEGSKMLDEIRLTVEQTTRRSLSTNFESNLCVYNYPIQVSKDIMEKTANTYASLKSKPYEGGESDPGTVRKMALSIIEHNLRWATIELLLKRGADPNYCKEPMHVIFFPVRAADVTGVQLLLEHGARTDVRFPSKYVREIVRLLLIHKADPNTLWSGHSPLSLSIASGNDLAVHELLLRGADPNLPLTKGVGSALCAAANLSFEQKRSVDGKIALVDRLIQFGADILLPVKLVQGDKTAVGTAVDYAYFKFFQDRRLAHTPLHSLTTLERETLVMRKKFLEYMGSRLRRAVLAKEEQWDRKLLLMSKKAELSSRTKKKTLVPSVAAPVIKPEDPKIPFFKYCYQCGRSIGVRLTPCLRCYGILTCSKHCKAKAWNESHKRECGAAKGETKVKEEEKKAKEMALKAQKDVKNVKTKKQDKLGSASWPKTPVTPSPPPYSENYSFV
ncbi:ankyrin repeat and MYND domain-containing protein 1 isoform X5 [Monodelphis domestica]|uniref:ankyrin repeat and MYND domain-containing protein 1 isoform X5 n=1 Tax=Monodelphis domestica TaxID=13616 RepID=UPI0024E20B27|nr:ankyrin repeat and MYND domain-containing protein 1 isoform X5 [Monodelphis domestica]